MKTIFILVLIVALSQAAPVFTRSESYEKLPWVMRNSLRFIGESFLKNPRVRYLVMNLLLKSKVWRNSGPNRMLPIGPMSIAEM